MIIYQVDIKLLDTEVRLSYLEWLKSHVKEMLEFKGFIGASILVNAEDEMSYSIRYQVNQRVNLEDYFETHAPRMREEGLKLFEGKFEASRKIYNSIEF